MKNLLMKTKAQLFALLLLTTNFSLFGQELKRLPVKKISIHEVSIQAGLFSEQNINPKLSDFKSLAPKSLLLNSDLSNYYSSEYQLNSNPMISLMIGMNVNRKQKITNRTNPLIKVGFCYFSGTILTSSLYKSEQKSYDTLTSLRTGQTVFVDSISSKSLIMNYSSNQIRLDGSLILRTNTKKRWSLFGGIGMTVGISIKAHTDIIATKSERTETHFANGTNLYPSLNSRSNTFNKETFRNKNNFCASTYIPVGIDFRIGNKKTIWKKMHLFYELRPGLNIISIPELRTITNVNLQQGIGIKFSWD